MAVGAPAARIVVPPAPGQRAPVIEEHSTDLARERSWVSTVRMQAVQDAAPVWNV